MCKRKRPIVQEEDCQCFLNVGIHRAEDIDSATKSSMPNNNNRIYLVYGWVASAEESILTHATRGIPNPEWQSLFTIPFDTYEPNQFLHLEVLRTWPIADPGCSKGVAIVGRTKIPLPKLDQKKTGRYGLVMQEGSSSIVPVGHIVVTLELMRM